MVTGKGYLPPVVQQIKCTSFERLSLNGVGEERLCDFKKRLRNGKTHESHFLHKEPMTIDDGEHFNPTYPHVVELWIRRSSRGLTIYQTQKIKRYKTTCSK